MKNTINLEQRPNWFETLPGVSILREVKNIFGLFLFLSMASVSCAQNVTIDKDDIIIENEQVKLIVRSDGTSKSLLFKPDNEECLIQDENIPLFSVTQERPFNNEIKLAHPNKRTTFQADTIYWREGKLIVGFELIPYEAVIDLKITSQYIRFSLADFIVHENDYPAYLKITPPPVSEMCFLQLPVRNRDNFGEWLNVVWDDRVAVNVLGTDPYARIDAEKRTGYRIMRADAVKGIKLKGTGAALIVCRTDDLLDYIGQIEEDYDLPRGVESRRSKMINASYYWTTDINPGNVDQHLKYAKMAGLRGMMLYYPCFIEGGGYDLLGNYEWKKDQFPNGKGDLKKMLDKIKAEGVIPGFHFLHSHIGLNSRYVTPVTDHRLNLVKTFTLAKPLGKDDTEVYVEQNPEGSVMADGCRVLKIGTELVSYTGYTTEWPYKFTGCSRGAYRTTVYSQPLGLIFGILDVSEFGATSVYLDQNTSLQDEIADKIANIYQAGFQFVYFDGSEGVNPPFGFHVPHAQYRVYKCLKPAPLFAEGAAKAHFSWHMLSGGNAFDIFSPETIKDQTRRWPCEEAPRMRNDFTRINFGWLGYWVPDQNTVGTQPDMLEYVTSRAAAWDCPVSIMTNLRAFDSHPRTADNLEVLRRWEDVRAQNWLTKEQKQTLQDLNQEHILLINEEKRYELIPYDQIQGVANGSKEIRAFIFERKGELYVVYWHISADKKLGLPLKRSNVTLFETLGVEENINPGPDGSVIIPAGSRRFLKTNSLTKQQLINAFAKAEILN